jgi:hypothetical protein
MYFGRIPATFVKLVCEAGIISGSAIAYHCLTPAIPAIPHQVATCLSCRSSPVPCGPYPSHLACTACCPPEQIYPCPYSPNQSFAYLPRLSCLVNTQLTILSIPIPAKPILPYRSMPDTSHSCRHRPAKPTRTSIAAAHPTRPLRSITRRIAPCLPYHAPPAIIAYAFLDIPSLPNQSLSVLYMTDPGDPDLHHLNSSCQPAANYAVAPVRLSARRIAANTSVSSLRWLYFRSTRLSSSSASFRSSRRRDGLEYTSAVTR